MGGTHVTSQLIKFWNSSYSCDVTVGKAEVFNLEPKKNVGSIYRNEEREGKGIVEKEKNTQN